MPEASITEVFGTGSTQTATELRINKPGLAALLAAGGYQFTPSADNTADELVAALVCAGLVVLTSTAREADPLSRNVEFRYDPTINFDSPVVDGQTFNRYIVEAAFYKAVPTPTLNPSDLK